LMDKALEVLERRLSRQLAASLETCVRCGICADSCHYYLADPRPEHVPAYRAELLRRIYRRHHDPVGRLFPGLVRARELDDELAEELIKSAYGTCTMCRRCVLNCPMGVDNGLIVRTARGMLAALGRVPKGLQDTVDVHLESGNNMAVSEEDFVETLEWLEEQLQDEVDDPEARIPVNQAGARVLYTLNPREAKYYPLTILAAAKVFYAAGESWTLSTRAWDVTNYALFNGDDEAAREIAGWLAQEAAELGVEEVVMAECGHGFRAFRWEGENWLGRSYAAPVRGFVELVAEYIRTGRIKLDPAQNPEPVTYHDPCNQARNGGILEEPRYILKHAVADFREMHPHGRENFCCGGGGGMMAMGEFAEGRLAAGRVKAEQIRATGAKVVATSCHNCLDQITELSKHYDLGIKVLNLCEVVAEAIILPGDRQ